MHAELRKNETLEFFFYYVDIKGRKKCHSSENSVFLEDTKNRNWCFE